MPQTRSEFQSQLVEFRTQLDSKVNCDIYKGKYLWGGSGDGGNSNGGDMTKGKYIMGGNGWGGNGNGGEMICILHE